MKNVVASIREGLASQGEPGFEAGRGPVDSRCAGGSVFHCARLNRSVAGENQEDSEYGNRYALRMDHPDSWTIFDVFTGQPAESGHKVMVGVNAGEADEMVRRLNDQDAKRRDEADPTDLC
ncbi:MULTISPECIES: hypothetical protein [Mesorhizobium]|uniref:Uncharacterized protein n=3 Tax=Mesorhizobium TaxID=68287 RepID=A0AB38TKK0_9HYPH|nr:MULTISPECIES: hypothetical protein [Mesorhizobium]MDF3216796.1 hypothetical protein [Mesorhizobium ciceri]UTU55248.1 hypothetical protein LRP29_31520 [Mesorhizobium ciceri]